MTSRPLRSYSNKRIFIKNESEISIKNINITRIYFHKGTNRFIDISNMSLTIFRNSHRISFNNIF